MPLLPLHQTWIYGLRTQPVPKPHVAKVLMEVGGYIQLSRRRPNSCIRSARVHWYKSIGSYPWRVSLMVPGFREDVFREVDDFPILREAMAAGARWVRAGAWATTEDGGSDWHAFVPGCEA